MHNVEIIRTNETPACLPEQIACHLAAGNLAVAGLQSGSTLWDFRARWNEDVAAWRAGKFYKCLPQAAISEFELLAAPYRCRQSKVLLSEGETPDMVLFLLEGKVKVTLNSIDGRRLILCMAGPGDILGLAAVLSGLPYQITAEAQYPCQLTSLPRRVFLDFLVRYPIAGQNVCLQLSQEFNGACDQLRTLGIRMASGTRLARLLLKWCEDGSQTDSGMRIKCSLTHAEIGECIGMSRETVSRTLSDFKLRELVEQRGSTMVISSVRALETYADRNCA